MNQSDYKIIRTEDGSDTVYWINGGVTFHSKYGAITESKHVFIQAGLDHYLTATQNHTAKIRILEVGYGTGLNALLSWKFLETYPSLTIDYTAIEPYPLGDSILSALNHCDLLEIPISVRPSFFDFETKRRMDIDSRFELTLLRQQFADVCFKGQFDLVYFDSFGPGSKPELWTQESLAPLYESMSTNGMLVTFCAQGAFKRALKAVGFQVEAIAGPPGKREMTRAIKCV